MTDTLKKAMLDLYKAAKQRRKEAEEEIVRAQESLEWAKGQEAKTKADFERYYGRIQGE